MEKWGRRKKDRKWREGENEQEREIERGGEGENEQEREKAR